MKPDEIINGMETGLGIVLPDAFEFSGFVLPDGRLLNMSVPPSLRNQRDFTGRSMSMAALARLKKYFATPNNLIKEVRQKYAFHTDLQRIADSLATLPPSEPLKVAITDSLGNVFAQFAEDVTNWSVLNAVNANDLKDAVKRLMSEGLLHVPNDFLLFGHGFAEAALSQCSPGEK